MDGGDSEIINQKADARLQDPKPKTSELSRASVLADLNLQDLLERIQRERSEQKERLMKKTRERRSAPMEISELVHFLRGENAQDICVIRVAPEREYVSYFITCSGMGTRHIRAMAENLAAEVNTILP